MNDLMLNSSPIGSSAIVRGSSSPGTLLNYSAMNATWIKTTAPQNLIYDDAWTFNPPYSGRSSPGSYWIDGQLGSAGVSWGISISGQYQFSFSYSRSTQYNDPVWGVRGDDGSYFWDPSFSFICNLRSGHRYGFGISVSAPWPGYGQGFVSNMQLIQIS